MVEQWTGKRASRQQTDCFFSACASRRVVSVPAHRKTLLKDRFQDDWEEAERIWKRIWYILVTICQTKLWTYRNDAVYQAATKDITSTTTNFWDTCTRQVRAIALREHRNVSYAIQGATLYACIELIEYEPRRPPGSTGVSPRQTTDPLALATWLRLFQRSCR